METSAKRRFWLKVLGVDGAHDGTGDPDPRPGRIERATANARMMQQSGYLDFPYFVHVETLAMCNAACEFCPYPGLERKGTKMPDTLIDKIIRELDDGRRIPFLFAPYKVSDPFLEPRLFEIIEKVAERLPNARVVLITNGAPLTLRKMERLAEFSNIAYLSVSLNSANAEEYERVMQIPFARTLQRLDELHALATRTRLGFPVRVGRVSGDREGDEQFLAFVEARYPAFERGLGTRNDWIGEVITPGADPRVPQAPCHRWFDLSIVATGEVAMCCMDGEARYSKGNARERHVLDIYNQPHLRRLREMLPSRRTISSPCNGCTYLSG